MPVIDFMNLERKLKITKEQKREKRVDGSVSNQLKKIKSILTSTKLKKKNKK